MKKKFINNEIVEGRLYQHDLEIKTVQNKDSANFGKEFISGTIDVATDEEGLNVVPIHFTYVIEMTKNGKKNVTYGVLKNIIEGAKCWVTDGKDAALKVRVSTALALNDFYIKENDEDKLVSAKRNEGGFVNIVKDLAEKEDQRNTFDCDMVITRVTEVEGNPEAGTEDFIRLGGAIFNYRADLLPVEFIVRRKDAIGYFTSLDISPSTPVFTEVKGNIISSTIKRDIEEQSAFGTVSVRTVTRNVKEWVVNWARPVEYDFGAEDTITAEELKAAMQNREVYLANIKKNRDEYMATKAANVNATMPNSMNVPAGDFNF